MPLRNLSNVPNHHLMHLAQIQALSRIWKSSTSFFVLYLWSALRILASNDIQAPDKQLSVHNDQYFEVGFS
jgi:hypothetical protein